MTMPDEVSRSCEGPAGPEWDKAREAMDEFVKGSACPHEQFAADVVVNRIEDVGRFMADVRVKCVQCGTPFRFVGLPAGMDYNSPCVSVDACEGRFPIAPKGDVLSELEGTPAGFSVRKQPQGES
jgi:hypothetical protein